MEAAAYATIPQHLKVRPIEITPWTVIQWIKPEPVSELEERCMAALKPGDYEIYDEKLLNFLDEAREVFTRAGVSGLIRSGDLIVAVYTANGDLASASAGTYLHCVTGVLPIKFVLHRYLTDPTVGVNEGDIFYTNEARYGGIHNPDQMAFMPVFNEGELIAWTAALAHSPETGAITRITQDQGRTNEEPSFAPTGRLLVFRTDRNGPTQLVVSDPRGDRQTVIAGGRGADLSSPAWGPLGR